MPALIGYMLAIVVTLGGYFVGLQWLISPPDPWTPNAKMPASAQHARKHPPVAKPAEIAAAEPVAAAPDIKPAKVEAPAPVDGPAAMETPAIPAAHAEPARAAEPAVPHARRSSVAVHSEEPKRSAPKPQVAVREVSPAKPKVLNRKLADSSQGRKLQLMVLRTYERPDGTRFTRLLPISAARNAMAFQLDEGW